jgi:hypothetical protein
MEFMKKMGIHGVKLVLEIKGVLGSEKVGNHHFMGSSQLMGVGSIKPICLCPNTLNALLP